MIGKTIAHYLIEAKLGDGGMGIVYRALDKHLDRPVALKVLRPEAVADPERKRRFVQEAKAASALNHPNIVTIYDIDTADGTDYIAMEYVAGKTLDQLIGRRSLPLREVLEYTVQIADALAAAHAAGIVHRDLKPANLMVTDKGLVKVLDFGLAKLMEPADEGPESATVSAQPEAGPHTEAGAILGTAAYMSPEQAEGKSVDARSDIFSFGSVLYEALSGRRAFSAETRMSTLTAILRDEPRPLGEVAKGVPRELERIVGLCLKKDPRRRLQHMEDLKIALQSLKEESDSGKLVAAVPAVEKPPRRRWVLALPVAVALVLIGILGGLALWKSRAPAPAQQGPILTRLTSDSGLTTDPAISADGKLLAYASDRAGEGNLDIWVQQLGGGGEPLRLTRDPTDDREPNFSPDGTRIAFRSEQEGGGIYVISALGGPTRRIAPEGRRPRFSPNGDWIAYWVGHIGGAQLTARNSKIYVVASAGGQPRQVVPEFSAAARPIWTSDGKHLLFLGNRDDKLPSEQSIDWWVAPLDRGPAIKTGALDVTRHQGLVGPLQVYPWALDTPALQAQGDSLVFSASSGDRANLWRIGISPRTWKVAGTSQRLTSGTTLEEKPSVASGPDRAVRVAFASLSENMDIWSLPIEPNQGKVLGAIQRLTQNAAADFHPALSADGKKMVFVSSRSGNQNIWIKDLRRGEETALTLSASNKYLPILFAEDSKVSFSSYENEKWNIFVVPTKGGVPEMVCASCGALTSWSSDGKRALFNYVYGQVGLLGPCSGRKIELLAHPTHRLHQAHFSPDERWITFMAISKSFSRVYIVPFAGEGPMGETGWIAVTRGESWDDKLRWSPSGNLIYFTSDRDGFHCIWAQRLDHATKRSAGAPFPVYHSHSARQSMLNMDVGLIDISVAHDKLVFTMVEQTGNIWMAQFEAKK